MVRRRSIDLQNGSLKKMAFVFCLTNAIFLSVCGVRMQLSRGGNEEDGRKWAFSSCSVYS